MPERRCGAILDAHAVPLMPVVLASRRRDRDRDGRRRIRNSRRGGALAAADVCWQDGHTAIVHRQNRHHTVSRRNGLCVFGRGNHSFARVDAGDSSRRSCGST